MGACCWFSYIWSEKDVPAKGSSGSCCIENPTDVCANASGFPGREKDVPAKGSSGSCCIENPKDVCANASGVVFTEKDVPAKGSSGSCCSENPTDVCANASGFLFTEKDDPAKGSSGVGKAVAVCANASGFPPPREKGMPNVPAAANGSDSLSAAREAICSARSARCGRLK